MSARGRAAVALSPGVIFLLLLCACGLAVHFIAEGLTPATGAPGLDLSTQAGHVHLAHEHSGDHFLLPTLIRPWVDQIAVASEIPTTSSELAFSLPPQLPPPNS